MVMRTGASDVSYRGFRGQIRPDARLKKNRKSRLRRSALEASRASDLAGYHPHPALISRVDVSNPFGNTDDNSDESTPSIAVDPQNSNHLVSAWTRFDTDPDPDFIGVDLSMSVNGGASWTTLSPPARRLDPSNTTTPTPFSRITDASVAFALDGSFYLLSLQHNDGNTAGAVILSHYDSGGGGRTDTTVYAWNRSATNQSGAKAIQLPVMADNRHQHGRRQRLHRLDRSDPGAVGSHELERADGRVGPVHSTDFSNPLVLNAGATSATSGIRLRGSPSARGAAAVNRGRSRWSGTTSTPVPRPTRPFSIIKARQVFNGGTTLGEQTNVAFPTRVRGNATGGGTIGGPTPQGIGPSPSIAADNTSAHSTRTAGRIYVTYVDRVENDDNPGRQHGHLPEILG